jgi:hypothetical protein
MVWQTPTVLCRPRFHNQSQLVPVQDPYLRHANEYCANSPGQVAGVVHGELKSEAKCLDTMMSCFF